MPDKYTAIVFAFCSALVLTLCFTLSSAALAPGPSANGSGSLEDGTAPNGQSFKRHFSFSARTSADGTVSGNAVLQNPAFNGENGNQPYMLQIDISCMKVYGNIAFFGGLTRRTNDPSLVDAVYFSIEDNGNPGAGNDQISRVFFFDDDPTTTGDPALCEGNVVGDFPMEPIVTGNITLRP